MKNSILLNFKSQKKRASFVFAPHNRGESAPNSSYHLKDGAIRFLESGMGTQSRTVAGRFGGGSATVTLFPCGPSVVELNHQSLSLIDRLYL